MDVFVDAVGVAAPGLPDWHGSQSVLRGESEWIPEPLGQYKPSRLSRNEARRTSELVRTAFRVCEDVASQMQSDLSDCATVFASSGGDYGITDRICRALMDADEGVSPIQFHNSVHNAPAGYWSIATGSRLPSTSISAFDDTFPVGLLEAAALCLGEEQRVLLVGYDISPPEPLRLVREVSYPFGVALLLSPQGGATHSTRLSILVEQGAQEGSPVSNASLEALRTANPIARSLPMLEGLAREGDFSTMFANTRTPGVRVDAVSCG